MANRPEYVWVSWEFPGILSYVLFEVGSDHVAHIIFFESIQALVYPLPTDSSTASHST